MPFDGPQTITLCVNHVERCQQGREDEATWIENSPIEIPILDLNVWVEAQCGFVIEMQTVLLAVLYTKGWKFT